ncbi:bifunctional pyr operon transcriptional regulator/uracil phosphoribosyltransferase PyrR [Candidatus Parabeggiatoa sp. HSG14]|uniref:bifunctional pyr operon transcriptional regulator/uracil phosphoribosyltransferase PyrR n=1 Tax=Candidatus Parabeggiatoa sp. HSG14 TaxID=3055593 RepID=UPI0025A717BC|nr:bifunctional pyr operon transcriptional regulator/uracil phosphoribosyltransferase PyrR [Thiotrichales bacterium HSG14]
MSINQIDMLLCSMANYLNQHLKIKNRDDVLMIGIHTGGVWVAERLHSLLNLSTPLGQLNIAFYRDDFSHIGLHPHVKPSTLPLEVENRHIILVDDVLHTGRTIRAALNEIFDYGRPASVTLAVLVERNGRELPIQPDVIGCSLCLENGKHIKLHGPDPLCLEIRGTA